MSAGGGWLGALVCDSRTDTFTPRRRVQVETRHRLEFSELEAYHKADVDADIRSVPSRRINKRRRRPAILPDLGQCTKQPPQHRRASAQASSISLVPFHCGTARVTKP